MSKQITIRNVTYKSFADAHRKIGKKKVSFALARKRLSRGWDPYWAVTLSPLPPELRKNAIFMELVTTPPAVN
jgi:hypothetical protein